MEFVDFRLFSPWKNWGRKAAECFNDTELVEGGASFLYMETGWGTSSKTGIGRCRLQEDTRASNLSLIAASLVVACSDGRSDCNGGEEENSRGKLRTDRG